MSDETRDTRTPGWWCTDSPELGAWSGHVAAIAGVTVVAGTDLAGRLASEPVSGLIDAALGCWSPDRLTPAASRGVPQVILPGGLDQIGGLPEIDEIGKQIAWTISAARGPVAVVIPTRRWSAGAALDPERVRVLHASLRNWCMPGITIREADAGIDEPECARIAVAELRRLVT